MNDEEIFGPREIALMQSKQFALQSVLALDLPTKFEVSGLSFEILGSKIDRRISIVIDQLRDEHGNDLPYLIAIAVRESWFACCEGAWYSSLMIDLEGSKKTDSFQDETTPEGYAEVNGLAGALAFGLGALEECVEQVKLRDGTPYVKRPSAKDLLECMAVYWLSMAVGSLAGRQISDAMNWIFEGLDALELANGIYMHNEGEVMEREATKADSSKKAKDAADARHNKPGGSNSKRDAIRAVWASGKFDTRDLCAEEEAAGLNMALSTARRALRNTPNPPGRCKA